jgi:ABC-2 type transport system permease protein
VSLALFAYTARKNSLLLVIFYAVLAFYLAVMISMYNPEDMARITDMLDLFPEDLMQAMGFSQQVSDLTSYLASWLYGLLMLAFPMVYCIILSQRLVARKVDSGSMAYLLATPNSRTRIIVTLGSYALLSVGLLFALLFGTGVALAEWLQPGQLAADRFLQLNITTMLINMLVIMIGFFFSCLCNDASLASGLAAGLPITFLLLNMLGGVSEDYQWLKRWSVYGWFDPLERVRGEMPWTINLIYAAGAAVLFAAAVLIFKRRQLPV